MNKTEVDNTTDNQECTSVVHNNYELAKLRGKPTQKVKIWDGNDLKLPVGSPTKLTPELARSLFTHVANGGKIAEWSRQPGHVDPATVWRWTYENEGFRDAFSRARSIGAHAIMDEADTLMSNESRDLYDNGKVIAVNTVAVQRDYRRAGLKQWLAGKLNSMYADNANTQVNVQVNNVIDAPSSEQREAWVKRKQAESLKKIG